LVLCSAEWCWTFWCSVFCYLVLCSADNSEIPPDWSAGVACLPHPFDWQAKGTQESAPLGIQNNGYWIYLHSRCLSQHCSSVLGFGFMSFLSCNIKQLNWLTASNLLMTLLSTQPMVLLVMLLTGAPFPLLIFMYHYISLVPQLSMNLLSIGQIVDMNCFVGFDN
jgi:hypothetical protein